MVVWARRGAVEGHHERRRRTLRSIGVRLVLLGAAWWILVGDDTSGLAFGIPIVAVATIVSMRLRRETAPLDVHVLSFVRLLGFFVVGSARGGWDVARRALSPWLPLSPVVFEYRLDLPRGPARELFLSTLTLMPGTIAIADGEDVIRIHALVDRGEQMTREADALRERVRAALRPRAGAEGGGP